MKMASSAPKHISSSKPVVPGEEGVWVFVLGDMCIFALLFVVFLHSRTMDPETFQASRLQLNQTFGVINTLLLLSSSWLVAMGLRLARSDRPDTAARLYSIAWLCGLGFAISKVLEYSEKFNAGITALSNDFFMYYFVLTGLHMFHVLIGLAVLAFAIKRCKRPEFNATDIKTLEGSGVFWHMVDLLWVVLFPLLYLLN